MELRLVEGELEAVDWQLASAEHSLFWHHEGTNTPPHPASATQGQRHSRVFHGVPSPCLVAAVRSPQLSHPEHGPSP